MTTKFPKVPDSEILWDVDSIFENVERNFSYYVRNYASPDRQGIINRKVRSLKRELANLILAECKAISG
jgi:hypothetical protein